MIKSLLFLFVIGFCLFSFGFVLHAGFSTIYDAYGFGMTLAPATGCVTTLLLIACLFDNLQRQEQDRYAEPEPAPSAHSAETGPQ